MQSQKRYRAHFPVQTLLVYPGLKVRGKAMTLTLECFCCGVYASTELLQMQKLPISILKGQKLGNQGPRWCCARTSDESNRRLVKSTHLPILKINLQYKQCEIYTLCDRYTSYAFHVHLGIPHSLLKMTPLSLSYEVPTVSCNLMHTV